MVSGFGSNTRERESTKLSSLWRALLVEVLNLFCEETLGRDI